MSHWSNGYIGLPYVELGRAVTGVDCWGLAVLVYRHELQIELPLYTEAYTSVEEHAELAAHIASVTCNQIWSAVLKPRPFDIAVFRRGHHQTHVGIVLTADTMLHVAADDQSKLERFTSGRWSHRLSGFYRHTEMA